MYIVHPFDLDGPAAFACAQSRCPECQDALVRQHEGLVHVVLRRQSRGDVPYEDLLQAGRIGLWQAVLQSRRRYWGALDPFSNYLVNYTLSS